MTKKVLFVCTGNICRSAMAEGLARNLNSGNEKIVFVSAGTAAFPGMNASDYARQALADKGIDISAHRAQPVTRELVESSDYIFCMTQNHLRDLKYIFPEYENKLYLFKYSALDSEDKNVHDPMGRPLPAYIECAKELEFYLKGIISDIIEGKNQRLIIKD